MILKGEMSMLNVLRLQEVDIASIRINLEKKRDEAPQFFMQSPVVVDCCECLDQIEALDFIALKAVISGLGFVPVGLRGIPQELTAQVAKSGWAVLRPGHAPTVNASDAGSQAIVKAEENENRDNNTKQTISSDEQESPEAQQVQAQAATPSYSKSVTIERPVRSGQQVYAAQSDMTVLAQTSAGSELVADGSIHVYGALRGRALAGARGNETARIFCNSLQAELIAIAGRYQLLDESKTDLIGKPAMIRLEGEKLIIEPLG